MIRAIIVDDEQNNISNLQALITTYCHNVFIVGTAVDADQARDCIFGLRPDVVFLDIHMPGQNGFELLKSIGEYDFEVIFVTAYDAYGIMAIKFSALDYLLKPISIPELQAAVEKTKTMVDRKMQNVRLENLLQSLDKSHLDLNQKLALTTLKETYLVPVKDIVRCESSNNYTTFFMARGSRHVISRPIYEYEELLGPFGFLRCHRSHLVNKIYIDGILNEGTGYVIIQNAKIPISRQKKKQIVSALTRKP